MLANRVTLIDSSVESWLKAIRLAMTIVRVLFMAAVFIFIVNTLVNALVIKSAFAQERFDLNLDIPDIEDPKNFDHLNTGFPLVGNHANLPCEQCHQSGVYERLSRRCDYCHNNVIAVGKPQNHVSSNAPCDTCHTTAGFMEEIALPHISVEDQCIDCHNGELEFGKPESHVDSSNDCDACHNNHSWVPVTIVDHAQLSIGSCIFCHNNVYAQGKNESSHLRTSNVCEACHSATIGLWVLNYMDHTQANGVCESCHNKVLATGPDQGHLGIVTNCDACHNVVDWSQVFYDHGVMSDKPCRVCHSGSLARGKGAAHIATSDLCSACHKTVVSWQLDIIDHAEVRGVCRGCHQKPGKHTNVSDACDSCHTIDSWGHVTVKNK